MAVKYFNLTITAMVINCAPLISTVLAVPILGERLKGIQIVYLLLAFGAVAIMILGNPTTGKPKEDSQSTPTLAVIALIFNPVAIAIGNIAMRSMKKLPEEVVSCWMSLSMMFV